MDELYIKNFQGTLEDASDKWSKKYPIYGDSWKNMSWEELKKRLMSEIEEFENAVSHEDSYEELLDVINCALMMAKREIDWFD